MIHILMVVENFLMFLNLSCKGWMSCCLIDKPLRLMKERKQHLLNDVRNNLQNYECCKELSLELCNTEEICSNQSPQEIITQEKLQKG